MSISKDPSKDQTYFLWTLTKDDLSHTLFPLGNIKKADTRSLARTAKLPNAERPDSQGLCFLGHVDMHSFLMRYIPARSGEIQSTDGIVLGMHDGVEFYTLGQRVATNAPEPHYVVGKDRASNVLTVSSRAEGVQPHTTYSLTEVNSNEQGAFKCNAAYRYHGELVRARVEGNTITFAKPVQVATGQSVVFYSDVGTVLGGGIIDACLK